jgi:putative ABC transport system permease protein
VTVLARVRLHLSALFRRSRFERDLADELQCHLEERVDGLVRSGLTVDAARRQARLEFGSVDTYKHYCRSVRGVGWLDDARIDFVYAWRMLRRSPAFTLVAVTTLAVSIGLNATLFTIVNGMGAGTPPVVQAERVVSLGSLDPAGRPIGLSYLDFQDWRRETKSLDTLAAYTVAPMNLTDAELTADRVTGAYISDATFSLVGERPILGRDFKPYDERPGAERVAIIAASLWKGRYGGDPTIIGRVITVNEIAVTVVGVMREGFRFPLIQDLWQPLTSLPGLADQARDVRGLRAFGRLAPGVRIEQARSELSAIAGRSSQTYPKTNANIRPTLSPFTGGFDLANPWHAMLIAISIVLLIACANIANLLLARAASRSHEIAIRISIGATRWRIVRQLVVESVLLAVLAGAASIGVVTFGVRLWLASMPAANWPYWYHFVIDRHVLAYIGGVSLGSVLLFGIGPSWHLSRSYPAGHLRDAARGTTGIARRRPWANALLGTQFALTLSLLAGAGLLARTLIAVYRADSIVDTSPVLLAGLDLPPQKYATPAQRVGFYSQLEASVGAVPSVTAAAIASGAPFYNAPVRLVTLEGQAPSQALASPKTSYVLIGSRYFDTLGLRLHRGRVFNDLDGIPGHETAIVNQLFASTYLPGMEPLGQRIRLADPSRPDRTAPWLTIIGVSPSVREHYAQEFDPVVYVPYRLNPLASMVLLARSGSDAAALAPSLRETLRQLDPDMPLVDVRPLNWLLSGTRFANQVFAALFGIAAVLGLLLAAIGLHAIITFEIRQRTQEIGVRMALGARPPQVVWLFVRRMLTPLAWGVAVGWAGALGVGQFVRGMLIQTSPNDPATLGAIAVVLITVALAAAFHPARRAAQLDPARALRYE